MPVLTVWARRMQAAFFGGVRVSPDDRTREETRTPPEPASFVIAEWFVVPGGLFWLAVQRSAFRPEPRARNAHAARARQLSSSRSGSLSLADSSGSRSNEPSFARKRGVVVRPRAREECLC